MKTDPILDAWAKIGKGFSDAVEAELAQMFADLPDGQASDEELITWARANKIEVIEQRAEGPVSRRVDVTREGHIYATIMLSVLSDDHGVKLNVSVRRYAPC
jgi:hypothetical protein